ncbi:hypothetical protein F4820DRAFT_261882 [Hypoxylon rubiginosum]|uniref:Uncharacterized protein n=1 Tax=Hypoxylon rubiginosum TaxID=110542 RepID=A0ACB9Z4Y3_9PEZI|nr:hypothetical protein F4820DRAFT_261882 [Hypoxylon rubiginosum]
MAPSRPFTYCEGAPSWNPSTYAADAALHERAEALLAQDNLQAAVAASFSLPPPRRDPYVYHAIVSVTLPEVQHVVSLGGRNGLHSWYRGPPPPSADDTTTTSSDNKPTPPLPLPSPLPVVLPPPPRPDTEAYLSIFDPTTSTPAALKTFLSNAKKGSLRAEVAAYLHAKRYLHPSLAAQLTVPKRAAKKKKKKKKKEEEASTATSSSGNNDNSNNNNNNNAGNNNNNPNEVPPNPYLPFLSWSARALEWAGPCPSSARAGLTSHHVLPVLMHHFGCACPSHEALAVLKTLAAGRGVIDMGSGGGYWSFMLRAYGVPCAAVDSAQSEWRVNWVSDTVIADGAEWLRRRRRVRAALVAGDKNENDVDPEEAVLLLVYPIVGGDIAGGREGDFTRSMMDAYGGDTLAVVGTQNHNGYTGFRGMSMDEYVEREHGGGEEEGGWVKVVQVALPSFPGKDEALFVFQRGPRAPAKDPSSSTGAAGQVSSIANSGGSSSSSNKGAT